MIKTQTRSCHCGAVVIEASGAPAEMGYCHCAACRAYSGAPVAAFTLWRADDVKVTKGAELLGQFKSSEFSERRFCTRCGSPVMTEHPRAGLTDVAAARLATVAFKGALHLNYEETVLPMKDGLPKLKDLPAHVGGSGETVPE